MLRAEEEGKTHPVAIDETRLKAFVYVGGAPPSA